MGNDVLADLLFPGVDKTPDFYLKKYAPRKGVNTGAGGKEILRLAPSPTGYLHLGNFYSAFIQYFEAQRTGGIFYLRLEDTDQKREIDNAGEIAYNVLVNSGVTPHEGYRGYRLPEIGEYGPYVQSKRVRIYHAFAKDLVRRGNAFPCFCEATQSKQEILERREKAIQEHEGIEEKDCCRDLTFEQVKAKINAGEGFALRLRSRGDGTGVRKVVDIFKGEREVKENSKDIILLKRNGIPPYALAHMVDDILMRTTKVIRGEDWFSSMPAHIELFEAAGFSPIQYGHNPLICTIDAETGNKRKLSKRLDPHADMRYYSAVGYPREAVLEYLLTIANSDFEIWRASNPDKSFWEFPFSLGKVGSNNPIFDLQKLDHISKNIIAKKTCAQVNKEVAEFFSGDDNLAQYKNDLDKIYKVLAIDRETEKPRKDIAKYMDIPVVYDYLFKAPEGVANSSGREFLHLDSREKIKEAPGSVKKALRLALTGRESGPDLFSIMEILGRQEVIKRLS